MSYLGENNLFSFRDNFCEPLPGITLNSSLIAEFGRGIASFFKRAAVGCSDEKQRPLLYALCSGIAECGGDVFVCECIDLPSFKHGLPLTGASIGIYISGTHGTRISFFGENGFPLSCCSMSDIMENSPHPEISHTGKITNMQSLRNIYINSIKDAFPQANLPVCAGISCGSRLIRELWREFFTDDSDSLIFQISDDGQNVNAYSVEFGFISCDRLKLAYSIMLWEMGQAVWLPDSFHYAASESAEEYGCELRKFNAEREIPQEAVNQRFLNDMLFMCAALTVNIENFYALLQKVPDFTTAKREITTNTDSGTIKRKIILEHGGRVILSGSGKNRISLLAQAHDAETAAELCSIWEEKLRRLSSCNNLFHPEH